MIRLILVLTLLMTAACATVGERTYSLPPDTARSKQVSDVPFINQSRDHCGPATLAMAMHWAGRPLTQEELASEVFTGKGSLQSDLISASRRHGMTAIPIEGMQPLLQEVAAGHPVIVFENLGFSWYPKWHYSVVLGYDLDRQELIMHSGDKAHVRTPMSFFERGWKLGGHWGLVVLPATKLAATAGVLEHLQSAVGLERAQRSEDAALAYQAILARWPGNLAALIGLGNVAFKQKNFNDAAVYLRKARELHPDSEVAKHNLLIAESALRASEN